MKANLIHWGILLGVVLGYANCAADEDVLPTAIPKWTYRRTITVKPPTADRDVVIPIVLTTDVLDNPYAHFSDDGSEVHFTGPDGQSPLRYWVENWNRRGRSKVWVKITNPGTDFVHIHYASPNVENPSDGKQVFDFFDDFNDGIWTKYPDNPVLTRTEPWETRCICEPSVIHEDGVFKMWFMGCKTSVGRNAALGYATSNDGFVWTKLAGNPILRDPREAIIRTTVIKHRDTYCLFASDHQWTEDTGVIRRWTSKDGLQWSDKTTVLRPTEPWERHFHNVHVIIENDGTWKMLYTTDGPFGYAYSRDGLRWTKHKTPVITGFYGGDPCLKKIGDKYYAWHSRHHKGHLRIYCSWSPDMIHWDGIYNDPQVGYTQPWERGTGRPEVHWDRHLADADLLEHDGKVLMYYCGAQCPLGVAVFDGTFAQLASRLAQPPLSQWVESHYGCVENNELRISDDETDAEPLYERTCRLSDQEKYVLDCRVRCYAGTSHRAQVAMRYVDEKNFARFFFHDNETTYYQECVGGIWSKPTNVGANSACDQDWHEWRIEVAGDNNRLFIDGLLVGAHQSNAALSNRQDLRIGLSVYNTYASFDDVRVKKRGYPRHSLLVGPEKRVTTTNDSE